MTPSPASRVVVIGHGMAGARLVSELRARDTELEITVFGDEPHQAYNRILLSNVVAGKAHPDDIRLTGIGQYDHNRIDLRSGLAVTGIDRAARVVHAADGSETGYDTLVLATGSRAWLPPLSGLYRPDGTFLAGVTPFRTLDDCHRILAAAEYARSAVVLGGGLLGLEAARGLARRELATTVLHGAGHLMNRQLDARAGRLLAATLGRLGVRSRMDIQATAVLGEERVRGVRLDDGEIIEADMLVISTGVLPAADLAVAAGLPVDVGILVDDRMCSPADSAVFAVGDCAQHAGVVSGLVAPAWEQVRVAADVITGADPAARYTGSRPVTRLKATGVDLAAMGEVDVDEFADDVEVLQYVDPARGTFKKLVIRDEILVGAILLGDNDTVGTVTQLFDRAAPVPADRRSLLFDPAGTPTDNPATLPDRVTICQCNNVTKGRIVGCWLKGARDLAGVVDGTRATTGCGTCRDVVAGIVEWLAVSDPAPTEDPAPAVDPDPSDGRAPAYESVPDQPTGAEPARV